METLWDLVRAAQSNDELAMIKIIDMFQPIIQKYTRMMRYDEDFRSEMVVSLIDLVHSIHFEQFRETTDYALINYIRKTLYHKYIQLSQNRSLLSQRETPCDNETTFEWMQYDLSAPQVSDDIALKDFLQKQLTEREYLCVDLIVLQGYSSTEVADMLGITKQAVNQCKKRALKKVKENI